MKSDAQPGDVVELADKEGGFTDPATGFDLSRDQQKELEEPIGERTQAAIFTGGLVVVKKPKSQKEEGDGDKGKPATGSKPAAPKSAKVASK